MRRATLLTGIATILTLACNTAAPPTRALVPAETAPIPARTTTTTIPVREAMPTHPPVQMPPTPAPTTAPTPAPTATPRKPSTVIDAIEAERKIAWLDPEPGIIMLNGPGESTTLIVWAVMTDRSREELNTDKLTFRSQDPRIARVSPGGIVTAESTGGAEILIVYEDMEGSVDVLVMGPPRQITPINPDRILDTGEIANRLMLELHNEYGLEDAEEIARTAGGRIIFEFRSFRGYIVETDDRSREEMEQAIQELLSDSRTARAYPDTLITTN